MEYLNRLNEKQKEAAVYTEGPLLILAGAGSGKTSTMTCRIAYLIEEMGVSPYNILAVTFTNKAAKEMRDRVEQLVGSGINMWILTFHSACLRILRSHCIKNDVGDQTTGVQEANVTLNEISESIENRLFLLEHICYAFVNCILA